MVQFRLAAQLNTLLFRDKKVHKQQKLMSLTNSRLDCNDHALFVEC